MDIKVFYNTVRKLKDVKRQGWVERGVKEPESVAEHSLVMALLCMVLPFEGDRDRAVRMALVHDIAESVTGDIITKESWSEGGTMTREEKVSLERKALYNLLSVIDGPVAEEIRSLWSEYEKGETREAAFVRDVDTAEMILQANDYYRKENFRRPLKGFWDSRNMDLIRDENIKKLLENIIEGGV